MKRLTFIVLFPILLVSCDRRGGTSGGSYSATSTGRVVEVDGDDAEMNAAMEKARETFGQFLHEVREDAKRLRPSHTAAMVKVYFFDESDPDGGEHLWVDEVEYDGEVIRGVVASEALDLSEPRLGSKVSFPLSRLSDWLIVDSGVAKGAFTVQLLRSRMSDAERAEHDSHYPFRFESR